MPEKHSISSNLPCAEEIGIFDGGTVPDAAVIDDVDMVLDEDDPDLAGIVDRTILIVCVDGHKPPAYEKIASAFSFTDVRQYGSFERGRKDFVSFSTNQAPYQVPC